MNTLIKRLGRNRHAVYGTLLTGATTIGAGLYFKAEHVPTMQDTPLLSPLGLIVLGSLSTLLAVAILIAIRTAPAAAVKGVIVVPQQPQLSDVQTHTRRTPELPQAA
jgi:hypothetical protein